MSHVCTCCWAFSLQRLPKGCVLLSFFCPPWALHPCDVQTYLPSPLFPGLLSTAAALTTVSQTERRADVWTDFDSVYFRLLSGSSAHAYHHSVLLDVKILSEHEAMASSTVSWMCLRLPPSRSHLGSSECGEGITASLWQC